MALKILLWNCDRCDILGNICIVHISRIFQNLRFKIQRLLKLLTKCQSLIIHLLREIYWKRTSFYDYLMQNPSTSQSKFWSDVQINTEQFLKANVFLFDVNSIISKIQRLPKFLTKYQSWIINSLEKIYWKRNSFHNYLL